MHTTNNTTAGAGGVYPIPRPAAGDDPRFTLGLAIDVAAALQHQGYPSIASGRDLTRLQRALFGFIYQEKSTS